jgi:hypothetical protein
LQVFLLRGWFNRYPNEPQRRDPSALIVFRIASSALAKPVGAPATLRVGPVENLVPPAALLATCPSASRYGIRV